MAQVYNKMQIDVNKRVAEIITAVQNDAQSRFLDVVLLDGSTAINLAGHEVRIYGKKADGTEFYNDGTITQAAAGRCQFELTGQALAVAQDLEVQLIVYRDNREILSTQPFKIHVVKSLIAAGAVESTNEYGALVVLYQKLYEAHALMTTMVQNIGVPGEVAKQLTIDTMWDAWEYLCNYVSEDLTALLQNAINNNSVDGVMQRIGKTADTGGSATAGTLMGKSNAVINRLAMLYNPTGRLKSFSAYVYGTDTPEIPDETIYVYPCRHFQLPANIRVIGFSRRLEGQANSTNGYSTTITTQIGVTTISGSNKTVTYCDQNGDFISETPNTDNRNLMMWALLPADALGVGKVVGTTSAERDLTVTMKIGNGYTDCTGYATLYYVEM